MSPDHSSSSPAPAEGAAPPGHKLKRMAFTLLKLAIAIVGVWWVIHNASWNDTATLPANTRIRNVLFPKPVTVAILKRYALPPEPYGPAATQPRELMTVRFPDSPVPVVVETDRNGTRHAEIYIGTHTRVPGGGELNVPHQFDLPRSMFSEVHDGLHSILIHASARWYLLAGAWGLLLFPFLVSTFRWRALLRPQGIELPFGKCLQLTFVGQFYSIMLPGITGGDLVKIIYTARLTGSKTKSLITVLLDRVIGLIALMTIAAVSAGLQLLWNHHLGGKVDPTLLNVFLLIVALLGALAIGGLVYFSHRLRRLMGIDWFMTTFAPTADPQRADVQHEKLEMLFRAFNLLTLIAAIAVGAASAMLHWETHSAWAASHGALLVAVVILAALAAMVALAGLVLHERVVDRLMPMFRKAVVTVVGLDEALHTYRGHFGVLLWAYLISLPSQLVTPLSAWLAGLAFGMTSNVGYYLAYVPVAVLAASLPISPPQGFGVMDYILFHFFVERGPARPGQALALAQAVRFLPLLWNAMGGFWVVTGSYSRHQAEAEERELDAREASQAAVPGALPGGVPGSAPQDVRL